MGKYSQKFMQHYGIVSLMCAYKSSIPVWIETLSGNSSDNKSFKKSISKRPPA